jgi:putative DNA primase/helicase
VAGTIRLNSNCIRRYAMQPETFDLGSAVVELNTHPPRETKDSESKVRAITIADFLTLEFPPRENILSPCLPSQGLMMLHAVRGIGKTHVGLGIAVAVASGGEFLRWTAPEPRGVLYLDGEMPAVVMQERLSRIIASVEKEPVAPLRIITPDLQPHGMPNISTEEGQADIEPHLNDINLVVVDNISTLCRGGRENEAESWLPVQEWALRLRARGLSVLFIHHAGKGGQQRGTSRREDVLDTVINLKHSGDYRPDQGACFEVHFEKARGIYGDDVKPFEAKLTTMPDGTQQWAIKDLEDSLTEKVADLLGEGMSQNDIAGILDISQGTVSKHKRKAQALGLITG